MHDETDSYIEKMCISDMDSFDINDVLRLGEHHKGWIHLYPTGFDFDVVDGNDAKCCI